MNIAKRAVDIAHRQLDRRWSRCTFVIDGLTEAFTHLNRAHADLGSSLKMSVQERRPTDTGMLFTALTGHDWRRFNRLNSQIGAAAIAG